MARAKNRLSRARQGSKGVNFAALLSKAVRDQSANQAAIPSTAQLNGSRTYGWKMALDGCFRSVPKPLCKLLDRSIRLIIAG